MAEASTLPDDLSTLIGASWQDQDPALRELWMNGKTPDAIAEAIGRSVSAIMTRAARLGLPRRNAPGRKPRPELPEDMQSSTTKSKPVKAPREIRRAPPPPPAKKTTPVGDDTAPITTPVSPPRICLMCLRTFQSVGRHNRICMSCKGTAEYVSASTLPDIQIPQT